MHWVAAWQEGILQGGRVAVLTRHQRVRQLAGVHLLGGHRLAELLHDQRLADGIGVADVRAEPAARVVQLLLPQVAPVRVVKAVVDGRARKVGVPEQRGEWSLNIPL